MTANCEVYDERRVGACLAELKEWKWVAVLCDDLKVRRELYAPHLVDDELRLWDGIADLEILDYSQWHCDPKYLARSFADAIEIATEFKMSVVYDEGTELWQATSSSYPSLSVFAPVFYGAIFLLVIEIHKLNGYETAIR